MNESKFTEIEIRFPLLNHEEMKKRLDKIAKNKKKDLFQKDTYFVPAHRNFLAAERITEWLRIRETKDNTILNYKNWYGKIHCDEFETVVENVAALKKIFESLNFKEIIVIEKIRNAWEYKGVIITIDQVTNLGTFIELETKTELDIEKAKKLLYDTVKEIKAEIGKEDFRGYPYLTLEKRGYNFKK